MLDSLPLGTYLEGTSFVHRLRARTKLAVLVWFAAILFVANHRDFHFGTYMVVFGILLLGLADSGARPGYVWQRMRLLVLLILMGLPFTLAWTPGNTWHTFGPVIVTYDGIWFAFSLSAIFLLLYLGSLTLTLTTSPVALAEATVLILRPLRRLRLPADEFGLMTLIALRFVPVLFRETEQLIRAQLSRGADFRTGSLNHRIKAMGALLVPMITGALRRAENLEAALEARGYGVGAEATLLHEGKLRAADWLVIITVPLASLLAYWKF